MRMAKQAIRDAATATVVSVIAGAVGGAIAGGNAKTRAIYNAEKNPPFAPPAWAFGVAWTLNNALVTWVGIQASKARDDAAGKRELLALLGAHAVLFYAWPISFTKMRSPIVAAAVTAADFGVTIAAATQAARIDKRYALGFSTILPWLTLATALATYVALKNDDPFFGLHREGNTRRERERIDAEMLRQQELGDRGTLTHYHGEDKVVADTFPASDPAQTP